MDAEQTAVIQRFMEAVGDKHAADAGRWLVIDSVLNMLIDDSSNPGKIRDDLLLVWVRQLNGEQLQKHPKVAAAIRAQLKNLGCDSPGTVHRR